MGDDQCEDCGAAKLGDVTVADLSYCRAPWECVGGGDNGSEGSASPDGPSPGLCRRFQKSWLDARLQMEDVHPQLEKGDGRICVDGQYQPMMLMKPSVA